MRPISSFMVAFLVVMAAPFATARAQFSLGAAADYGFIAGPNTTSVQISNSIFNGNGATDNPNTSANGNYVQFSSGTINGNFSFVGTAQTNLGGGTLTGSKIANDSNVSAAFSAITNLSNTAAGYSAMSFNGYGSINAANGSITNGISVFSTTASNFLQNGALTITGSANDYVIINVTGNNNVQLKNELLLSGGITDDHVLINILGSAQQVGGNTNGGDVNGVIVALNDKFNINDTTIDGRVFGGGSYDFQLVSGFKLDTPLAAPAPSSGLLVAIGIGVVMLTRLRRRAVAV